MDRIRTFIAIELSKDLKDEILKAQESLKLSAADVKWVEYQNLHLTLKFLGDVAAEKIDKISGTLNQALHSFSSFFLSLEHLGAFPSMNSPRVIWVAAKAQDDKVKKIAEIIQDSLVSLKFPKEARDFKTHVTLGRVRGAKNKIKLSELLKVISVEQKQMSVGQITLFKSTLSSQGPHYEVLSIINL